MSRKKVGITGQSGFIGTHLYNYLGLFPDRYERIPFNDNFFDDSSKLASFMGQCDVVVHLAAVNRHPDIDVLYDTNLTLVQKVIKACDSAKSKPHIIFSSSIQEETGNKYGNSKKEGRMMLEDWARENNSQVTSFLLPNIFGPFGRPFHNSVVSTFCHLLTHGGEPKIDVDNNIGFIHVHSVAKAIANEIGDTRGPKNGSIRSISLDPYKYIMVSELLKILVGYKESYFNNGIIPSLGSPFERDLFNTFMGYIDFSGFFPFKLKSGTDDRGSFVEVIRTHSGGQVSYSTTKPGITRGDHFHTRKMERFAVLKGKAKIDFRKIGDACVYSFELDGSDPSFVDMPIWYTHNITNIGSEDLYTLFWISEHFDTNDPDTFPEKV